MKPSRITWLLIAATLLLPQYRAARAESILVEAEDYFVFNEIFLVPIGEYIYGSYVYLQGLDYPGEWTKYALPVTAFGSYTVTMICWGDNAIPYHLRLYLTPQSGGDTQVIDFQFLGKGCFV